MTNEKTYFTIEEALEDIQGTLRNGYDGYGCDLHNEVFNTDYYIIGSHEAKQALEQYGTFAAIEEIKEYEQEHFGEVFTDLSDPEKVANMLYYIKGEEAISKINEETDLLDGNWNNELDEEINVGLVKVIDTLIR